MTPAFDPTHKLRCRIWLWRCGVGFLVIALGWLWVRSLSRIDVWSVPAGKGWAEIYSGGSVVLGAINASQDEMISFGDRLGPPDSEHLLHYSACWIDGKPLGQVSASCLFAPHAQGLSTADLDQWGSFGWGNPGSSAFFLRCPIWFGIAILLGGWLWLEHSYRRRLKLASPPLA